MLYLNTPVSISGIVCCMLLKIRCDINLGWITYTIIYHIQIRQYELWHFSQWVFLTIQRQQRTSVAARGTHCALSANTRWLCALLVVLKSHSVLLDWSCVYMLWISQRLLSSSNTEMKYKQIIHSKMKENICEITILKRNVLQKAQNVTVEMEQSKETVFINEISLAGVLYLIHTSRLHCIRMLISSPLFTCG